MKCPAVNPTSLQDVNTRLTGFGQEGNPMVIYPVPVEVTQARIQLVVDQNAKAPPNTINQDLQAVWHAKAAAVEAALAEVQANEPPLLDVKV
jgi:hypothetical protein